MHARASEDPSIWDIHSGNCILYVKPLANVILNAQFYDWNEAQFIVHEWTFEENLAPMTEGTISCD